MRQPETARIFNIERYHIHDGQGIRTAVFFKNCHLRCPWCSNPESQDWQKQLLVFDNLCTACGMCEHICPESAAYIENNLAHIDTGRCTCCGRCIPMCPFHARRIYGQDLALEELMKEILKDSAFYSRSQGGVTLTGGEPLLQSDFVSELIKRCHSECLPVAIETSGLLPASVFSKAALKADELLIDVKTTVPEQAVLLFPSPVKGDEALFQLKQNLKAAVDARIRTIIRCPIIPGFNNTKLHIRSVIQWAQESGVGQIDLLPFHQYGKHKYRALQKPYSMEQTGQLYNEDMLCFQKIVEAAGIRCVIGG